MIAPAMLKYLLNCFLLMIPALVVLPAVIFIAFHFSHALLVSLR